MNLEYILVALVATAITIFLCMLFWRKQKAEMDIEIRKWTLDSRELEKKTHLREREFLDERNQIELAKLEALRNARAAGFEEGRAFGQTERQRDHLAEITSQRAEFSLKLTQEKETSAKDACDRLRAEYELQTKLFTVKICPYLKIIEDKSLFNKKHELISGYQYQLLINGIPAFSPHVVPERTEIKSEINPEIEKTLLVVAEKAADAAINAYLGGNIQFAKRTAALVDRTTK